MKDKPTDERGWQYSAGWDRPRFLFQFTPFTWALLIAWSSERVGLQIGPFAVALEWLPRGKLFVLCGYFRDGWGPGRVQNTIYPKPPARDVHGV